MQTQEILTVKSKLSDLHKYKNNTTGGVSKNKLITTLKPNLT